jgi:hypothetical protein
LFVTHFFKCCDDGNSFLSVEKESAGFGFDCGCWNSLRGFAEDMDYTVGFGLRRIHIRTPAKGS